MSCVSPNKRKKQGAAISGSRFFMAPKGKKRQKRPASMQPRQKKPRPEEEGFVLLDALIPDTMDRQSLYGAVAHFWSPELLETANDLVVRLELAEYLKSAERAGHVTMQSCADVHKSNDQVAMFARDLAEAMGDNQQAGAAVERGQQPNQISEAITRVTKRRKTNVELKETDAQFLGAGKYVVTDGGFGQMLEASNRETCNALARLPKTEMEGIVKSSLESIPLEARILWGSNQPLTGFGLAWIEALHAHRQSVLIAAANVLTKDIAAQELDKNPDIRCLVASWMGGDFTGKSTIVFFQRRWKAAADEFQTTDAWNLGKYTTEEGGTGSVPFGASETELMFVANHFSGLYDFLFPEDAGGLGVFCHAMGLLFQYPLDRSRICEYIHDALTAYKEASVDLRQGTRRGSKKRLTLRIFSKQDSERIHPNTVLNQGLFDKYTSLISTGQRLQMIAQDGLRQDRSLSSASGSPITPTKPPSTASATPPSKTLTTSSKESEKIAKLERLMAQKEAEISNLKKKRDRDNDQGRSGKGGGGGGKSRDADSNHNFGRPMSRDRDRDRSRDRERGRDDDWNPNRARDNDRFQDRGQDRNPDRSRFPEDRGNQDRRQGARSDTYVS